MKLVLLTDLHLTGDGAPVGGRDPLRNLRQGLQHILANHADAACAVIMGDMSNDGSLESYELLRRELAALPFPVYLTLGNHDQRGAFSRVFGHQIGPRPGFAQQSFGIGSQWRGITLDTHCPGAVGGCLDRDRLDWLEDILVKTERQCLLFMHHPPLNLGLPAFDAEPLKGRALLGQVLQRHRAKLRHIFFGHCHLPVSASWMGIPASAIRGTNHASWPNFADPEFQLGTALPQTYGLMLLGEQNLVLHAVEFGHQGRIAPSREFE